MTAEPAMPGLGDDADEPRHSAVPGADEPRHSAVPGADEPRHLADVPAVEVVGAAAVHLMTATATKLGLAEDRPEALDLAEARILLHALAGLVTAAAPELGHHHAAPLRDGLRTLQAAFREASPVPDEPGQGPGERTPRR